MKDKDGNTLVMDPYGNIFAKIPEGFEIIDSKEFLIIKNSAGSETSTLEIKGNKFKLLRDSKISFSEKDGLTNFKLEGSGSLNLNGKEINNIKNAVIRVDKENQIEFAEFISTKEENYKFTYNYEEFEFRSNKDSHILFNPKDKKISAKNSELNYKNQLISGDFDATLDEKGIKEISLEENAIYLDRENGLRYSSKGEYNIYFDGRDVSSEKNAVSILKDVNDREKVQVNSKGKIKIENFEKHITYEGLNEEVYTNYMSKDSIFDITKGDAVINNAVHEVKFENGKHHLSTKNLLKNSKDAESFTVKYTQNGEDPFYARINEASGNVEILSFKEGEKTSTIISPFEKFEENQKKLSGDIVRTYLTDELDKMSNTIKSEESSGETVSPDLRRRRDALRSVLNDIEVKKYINQKDYDGAIAYVITSLEDIKDGEVKAKTYLSIAEFYQAKANSQTDPALKEGAYTDAIRFYELSKKDANTFEDASFNLAGLHSQNGDYNKALEEYNNLITKSNDKKIQSNAHINEAEIYLKIKNPIFALQAINFAVTENPKDEYALSEKKKVEIALLDTISSSIDTESTKIRKEFEEKIGMNDEIWNMGVGKSVMNIFGHAENVNKEFEYLDRELNSQQKGILAIKGLMNQGYTLEQVNEIITKRDQATIRKKFNIPSDDKGRYAGAEMLIAMQDAFRNPDVKNLVSGGKEQFNFEKGKGYVDDSFLKTDWRDGVLDAVTMKNAAILGPGAEVGGVTLVGWAGRAIASTSAGARVIEAASAIKTTLGSTKIAKILTKEYPSEKIPKFVDALMKEVSSEGVETAVGVAAEAALPGSGGLAESIVGNSRGQVVKQMISHGKVHDLRDVIKSGMTKEKVLEMEKDLDPTYFSLLDKKNMDEFLKTYKENMGNNFATVGKIDIPEAPKIGRSLTLDNGEIVEELIPFDSEQFAALDKTFEKLKKEGRITSLGDGTYTYKIPHGKESLNVRIVPPDSGIPKIEPIKSLEEDLERITPPDGFPTSEEEIAKAIKKIGGENEYLKQLKRLGLESEDYLKGNKAKGVYIVQNGIQIPKTSYAYLGASDNFLDLVRKNGLDDSISSKIGEVKYAGDIGYARKFTETIEGQPVIFRWKLEKPALKSTLFKSKPKINSNLIEYSTDQGTIMWYKLSETASGIPYYMGEKQVVGVTTSAELFTEQTLGLEYDNKYNPSHTFYKLNPDIQNNIKEAFTGITK
ncbi:MAG: hypothetical protein PHU63_03850 [Candidatus ainarchaeum sp.]|nr:hypothetical protein [Candidatus ainarchaeum sp.]